MKDTPLQSLSKDEILALFDRYRFRDEYGHDLLYCQDFQDLVEMATDAPQQGQTSLAHTTER